MLSLMDGVSISFHMNELGYCHAVQVKRDGVFVAYNSESEPDFFANYMACLKHLRCVGKTGTLGRNLYHAPAPIYVFEN